MYLALLFPSVRALGFPFIIAHRIISYCVGRIGLYVKIPTGLPWLGGLFTPGKNKVDAERSEGVGLTPPFTVTKSRVATVDQTADVSRLRWIGTEFIYFLDIPWNYELSDTRVQETSRMASSNDAETDLSTRAITIGLLEDIMDMQIPEECLLSHTQAGQRVLSGDNLSRLVVPWARELCDNGDLTHDPLQRRQYNRNRLTSLMRALEAAVYSKAGSLLDDGPDADMLCAVVVMFKCLERCIQAISHTPDDHSSALVDHTRMLGEAMQIIRRKFSQRWGEHRSDEMEHLLNGSFAFAAYAVGFKPTTNNVMTVDTADYKPRHTDPGCTCAFVKPSVEAVCERVRKGEVPVITFDGTELHVRSARDTKYVAISHVWADGLGSSTEEGLPQCQVARLSRLASSLVEGGAFWQDGLCIPEECTHRNLAIVLMTETYADADKVLVLDEGLRSSCRRDTPAEEVLMRIATSGWQQRIWTLQEGMLGRELYFELTDTVIDCTYFNGDIFYVARGAFPLLHHRRGDTTTLTYTNRLADRPKCTINDLIGLLRYRTTSKRRDEPIAISGLLGIDNHALVVVEEAQARMRELYIRVRNLPRQLAVFGWYCNRLSLPNFGWAPESLSTVLWPEDRVDAICTEDGLFGDFTVVRFPEVSLPEDFGIIVIVDEWHGQNDPKAFNLVLSNHFYREPKRDRINVGGFLIKGEELHEAMRDDAVGAVVFPAEVCGVPHPVDAQPTLACKFAAPASLQFGLPQKVKTSRTQTAWAVAHATVETMRKIRLT